MYVKIYFPQETIISAMVVPDFSYNQAYYNDLSPADNSIRFSILFNTNIANLIKTNINRNIKVEVKNTDDTNYFTGFLKKNVAFSKDSRNNNISIEVVSPTAILDEQFSSEAWYTNISLSNAVENMLEACRVDNYNLSNLPSITLPVFHIEEKSNVKTELTELLFEYGFCFDFDNDGVFICNPLFNEPPEVITNTFTDGKTGNLIGTVTQTLQERRFDGVAAEYNKLIQKSNQLIFSDTSTHEVKAGSKLYDNEEGTYTEYDSTVGEPFYIQSINNWIVGNDVYKINKLLPESARWKGVFTNYGKRGLLSVTNKLNQDLELTNVEIYGSGFFIAEGEKAVNQDGKNLEEFFLDYIFDSENASRFAENVRKYYKFSNIKLLLHSYDDYAYGSFCVVSVAGMGTVKGRIVQKKKTLQSNLIEYTIEAIEEFTPAEIKIETSANSNQASAITNQVVEQITPAIEQIVEPVVESSIATVYPRYRGSFEEFPLHEALNKGDWIFISGDGELYLNKYDEDIGYTWELIEYSSSTEYMFNAASLDLIAYATETGQIGRYAEIFTNNLSALKILFKYYVASIQNPTARVGDQLISMGRNPKDIQSDEYSFLIQECISQNPEIWQKKLWTEKNDNGFSFNASGVIASNTDVKVNNDYNSIEISTSGFSTNTKYSKRICFIKKVNEWYFCGTQTYEENGKYYLGVLYGKKKLTDNWQIIVDSAYLAKYDSRYEYGIDLKNIIYSNTSQYLMYYKQILYQNGSKYNDGSDNYGMFIGFVDSGTRYFTGQTDANSENIIVVNNIAYTSGYAYIAKSICDVTNRRGEYEIVQSFNYNTLQPSINKHGLCYANGKYICGNYISYDFENWVYDRDIKARFSIQNYFYNTIIVDGQIFLAYSTDGINYTECLNLGTDTIFKMQEVNGLYFLVTNNGNVYFSSDGRQWEQNTNLISCLDLSYFDESFFSARANGKLYKETPLSLRNLSTKLSSVITDYVPNTRKVNGKALSADITLGVSDITNALGVSSFNFTASSKYIKLSNGLIIQWGYLDRSSNLSAGDTWRDNISMPESYKDNNFNIFVTSGSYSSTTTQYASGAEIATHTTGVRSFTFSWYNRNASTTAYSPRLYWFTIGAWK